MDDQFKSHLARVVYRNLPHATLPQSAHPVYDQPVPTTRPADLSERFRDQYDKFRESKIANKDDDYDDGDDEDDDDASSVSSNINQKDNKCVYETLDNEESLMQELYEIPTTFNVRVQKHVEDVAAEAKNSAQHQPQPTIPIKHKSKLVRVSIIVIFLLINLLVFMLLMVFRQFPELSRGFAKNSAALTVVDGLVLVLTINRTSSNKNTILQTVHVMSGITFTFFSLVHTIAHVILLYNLTLFVPVSVLYYAKYFAFEYSSGTIMLLALLILLGTAYTAVRKYRFNLFYFTHVTCWTIFALAVSFHSYYLLLPVAISVVVLYMSRFAVRCLVNCRLSLAHIGKQFVVVNLRIRNTRIARWLVLNRLFEWQGDADIWISTTSLKNHSRFERHPYTMIEIAKHKSNKYCDVLLMVSSSGDWKNAFFSAIRQNANRELYSYGVKMVLDSVRRGDFREARFLRCTRILFLLENAGIASFLAYLRFVCEPNNRPELHDRVRTLDLHFRVDDLDYLIFLDRYISMAEKFKFIVINYKIYSTIPALFRGESTTVANRINHRRVLSDFLSGPGKSYVYTNDRVMHDRVERELARMRAAQKRKPPHVSVSL